MKATSVLLCHGHCSLYKDAYNRKRGLNRLAKQVKAGKLIKSNINNEGYNKYLKVMAKYPSKLIMKNTIKFRSGLKVYNTNAKYTNDKLMENYKNLWQIEKAFRISKTDLRIRLIYHRLHNRIEAHICILFIACSIYNELDRVLYEEKSFLSSKEASELRLNIYQLTYTLPESKQTKKRLHIMDEKQKELYDIAVKNFKETHR